MRGRGGTTDEGRALSWGIGNVNVELDGEKGWREGFEEAVRSLSLDRAVQPIMTADGAYASARRWSTRQAIQACGEVDHLTVEATGVVRGHVSARCSSSQPLGSKRSIRYLCT